MNCQTARNHLLGSERPARPANAVAAHLSTCPDCRTYQQRLLQLERGVPLLPVAPSSGKVDLVREVLHGTRFGPVSVKAPVRGWQRKERGLRKLAAAFALAAGLLFFAVGWWVWQHRGNPEIAVSPTPRHSRGESLAERVERLSPGVTRQVAEARTSAERLRGWAHVADDLRDRVRRGAEAGDAEQMRDLARLYEEVVRDGILAHARGLPGDDRPVLFSIADRLKAVGDEATRLAEAAPAASAEALLQIASVARTANQQLRALARGEEV